MKDLIGKTVTATFNDRSVTTGLVVDFIKLPDGQWNMTLEHAPGATVNGTVVKYDPVPGDMDWHVFAGVLLAGGMILAICAILILRLT
ncbi:MAG: hypothetical protein WC551_12530 [Patescibacteria group bacterium]